MKRRDFLVNTLASAGALTVGASLLACGDDGDGGAGDPIDASTVDAPTVDASDIDAAQPDAMKVCIVTDASAPSNSHGHTIAIPKADIDDPQDRSYMSTVGTTAHDHLVTITAAQFTELATNCTVTVLSNDTHAHTWVVTMVG